jgi:triosephosphate isomerase
MIHEPFFEIGPKTYVYGEEALKIALAAEEASIRYGVDVIFSAQYTDIYRIAQRTSHIHVFAQHMDSLYAGRGIGAVLPEALKEAGAEGVLLNHEEKQLTLAELSRCIERAREAGLTSVVCAGSEKEACAAACLSPDIIIAESPLLIGGGERSEEDAKLIRRINEKVRAIDPKIKVLHGAGIHDETDVYNVILSGADATGSTSGIMKAEDPCEMTRKMIEAVARAWSERAGEARGGADNGIS